MTDRIAFWIRQSYYQFIIGFHNLILRLRKRARFNRWVSQSRPAENYLGFNAKQPRRIFLENWEKEKRTLIVTCYFTRKEDPQLGITRIQPDIEYIRPWYDSLIKLKLDGVILHDGLDVAFISQYENEHIKFRRIEYGNYSIFEERWFAYFQVMDQLHLDNVFFTDINDVYITKNPFLWCNQPNTLYIGRDNANKIRHSGWLEAEQKRFEKDANIVVSALYKYQHVYNAGVVGGDVAIVKALAASIINYTLMTTTKEHKDMTLINLSIFSNFPVRLYYNTLEKKLVNVLNDPFVNNEHLFSGYPLNSAFKSYELDSDAFFIHK